MGNAADVMLIFYESKSYCEYNRRGCATFEKRLKKLKDCTVHRLFYEEHWEDFRHSKDISSLISYAGIEMLPATVINDQIVKIEEYPGRSELRKYIRKQAGT